MLNVLEPVCEKCGAKEENIMSGEDVNGDYRICLKCKNKVYKKNMYIIETDKTE
jgi:plasmid maintenance system killer protein